MYNFKKDTARHRGGNIEHHLLLISPSRMPAGAGMCEPGISYKPISPDNVQAAHKFFTTTRSFPLFAENIRFLRYSKADHLAYTVRNISRGRQNG